MKRLRGCLMVFFIFACGFLAGGFLGAVFGWMSFFNKVVKGGPAAVEKIVIDRIRADLRLKGEQRAEAKKIVQETAVELDAATRNVRPQVEEILGRAEQRLHGVLTSDDQRARLERVLEPARRRWHVTPAPAATPEPVPTTPPAAASPADR